jgi:hypothetical protein
MDTTLMHDKAMQSHYVKATTKSKAVVESKRSEIKESGALSLPMIGRMKCHFKVAATDKHS